MLKILSLAAYYHPEIIASSSLDDNRNEAFIQKGFELCIYTPMPTRGISEQTRQEYKSRRVETQYDGKLVIHRFRMFREGKNPVMRAFRYALCCLQHFIKGVGAKEIDLIFVGSTPPILGATAALVKRVKRVPMVYNLQDIFPDSLVGTGLTSQGSLLWRIGRVIEDFTYRNSDRIIVISEDFKRNIMAKGVPEEKIEVVYNWVDEQAIFPVERQANKLFDRYGLERDKFYLTYCGNIGLTQNMDMLLTVAEKLKHRSDIMFVLIGEGVYKSNVIQLVEKRGLHNVKLLPYQPYEDIAEVFSLGDVGLVISKPGVGENSVPSKTWSILSAGRPVLASFDENSLKQIVERNKIGIFTQAGDEATFTQAILRLADDQALREQYGRNGRQFILNNLTRSAGTARYVEIVSQFEK